MPTPALLLIPLSGAALAVVGCGSTDVQAPSTVPPRDIIAAVAGALGPDAPLAVHADITSSEPDATADGVDLMQSRVTFKATRLRRLMLLIGSVALGAFIDMVGVGQSTTGTGSFKAS